MSDHAGLFCTPDGVRAARQAAADLNARIRRNGIAHTRAPEMLRALQWYQMALASEAIIAALDSFVSRGGGSRGARAIIDPAGDCIPQVRDGALDDTRFRAERDDHKAEQILVRLGSDGALLLRSRPNRDMEGFEKPFFERDWPDWLTGSLFRSD